MTCTKMGNVILCSFVQTELYLCFEHTTYRMEFSERFGPYFWRIECGKEIDVFPEFSEDDFACTKYAFLWDIFDEWWENRQIKIHANYLKMVNWEKMSLSALKKIREIYVDDHKE